MQTKLERSVRRRSQPADAVKTTYLLRSESTRYMGFLWSNLLVIFKDHNVVFQPIAYGVMGKGDASVEYGH
jgi:hypothetical protein